jgi:hypothetical protein
MKEENKVHGGRDLVTGGVPASRDAECQGGHSHGDRGKAGMKPGATKCPRSISPDKRFMAFWPEVRRIGRSQILHAL